MFMTMIKIRISGRKLSQESMWKIRNTSELINFLVERKVNNNNGPTLSSQYPEWDCYLNIYKPHSTAQCKRVRFEYGLLMIANSHETAIRVFSSYNASIHLIRQTWLNVTYRFVCMFILEKHLHGKLAKKNQRRTEIVVCFFILVSEESAASRKFSHFQGTICFGNRKFKYKDNHLAKKQHVTWCLQKGMHYSRILYNYIQQIISLSPVAWDFVTFTFKINYENQTIVNMYSSKCVSMTLFTRLIQSR